MKIEPCTRHSALMELPYALLPPHRTHPLSVSLHFLSVSIMININVIHFIKISLHAFYPLSSGYDLMKLAQEWTVV